MTTLVKLLPAFLGVLFGLYLYFSGLHPAGILLALAPFPVLGALAYAWASADLPTHPVRAVRVWQGTMLVPFALIALTTLLTTALSLRFVDLLAYLPEGLWRAPRSEAEVGRVKEVVTGAVGTMVAGLWLDDAKDPKSRLWPAGQLKAAFESAFRPLVDDYRIGARAGRKVGNHDHRDLDRRVSGLDDLGWDRAAALTRARFVARFL